MSWTNTGGGDHEGNLWTPADTTTVAGVHYNISTFTVTNGYTINIDTGNEFEVYANTVSIVGIINGVGRGQAVGTGVGNRGISRDGGGGGGYGGVGGAGGHSGGSGGLTYGSNSTVAIQMGSGGGIGVHADGTDGAAGGVGGGSVYLAANTLTVSGTINCNGSGGINATSGGGGGGASGGGVILTGCAVVISGTVSCSGGGGGDANSGIDGNGGGGGGGRIKIFYRTLNTSGSTITVAGGGIGSGGIGGVAGTVGTNTSYELAQCTSTLEFGQTFTPGPPDKIAISSVDLYVLSVATPGDFTLTIYDDTGKGINYGSKSITVYGTGEKSWTFDNWIELPDGTDEYYMELVADAGGDIDLGIYGNEPITGDYYYNSNKVERFAAYLKLNGVSHVDSPEVYNIADITVKCCVVNEMLIGAIHRINIGGIGTVNYDDDFTTEKWKIDSVYSSIIHHTTKDELDIATSGFIYWKVDTKYPPTGIPTFEAQINVTAGTPTIKIAADSGGSPDTWYNIDTAIVDDVLTIYELDNTANLSIKKTGTPFYVKIECPADATVSVKTIEINTNIVTIDAEHPRIKTGGSVNTFRCDQHTDSGIYCTIDLIYRNRSVAG